VNWSKNRLRSFVIFVVVAAGVLLLATWIYRDQEEVGVIYIAATVILLVIGAVSILFQPSRHSRGGRKANEPATRERSGTTPPGK